MTAAVASFHVLIVEDDPSSSEFVQSALQRAGFESDVAATVSEALLHVEQDWPQAVILDLRLPDADGTVLLRRLKRDRRKTRVAVVTGVADLSGYVDVMHFPPDLLLPKPVNLRKLLKWLDHTRLAYDASEAELSTNGDTDADTDGVGDGHTARAAAS